ncbi:hypothetical protein FKM82_002192 [Ascaphus truei]
MCRPMLPRNRCRGRCQTQHYRQPCQHQPCPIRAGVPVPPHASLTQRDASFSPSRPLSLRGNTEGAPNHLGTANQMPIVSGLTRKVSSS